jgi:FkbM family methyltransferase
MGDQLSKRLVRNWKDARTLGPGILLRHAGRFRKTKLAKATIKGVGTVHVRQGGSDIEVLRQVFSEHEYAMPWPSDLTSRMSARYQTLLAQGRRPIIVDAGANIGAASLWFSRLYPEACVAAIEPDPENVEILRMNLAGHARCRVIEAAIGAEGGFARIENPHSVAWAVRTIRAHSGLPVVTVADAFAASGGDEPFIVKVDIEGFESDLFASNLDWLEKTYAVIIEPHDWLFPGKLTSRNFQKALSEHPFEMFIKGENLFYVRV